MTSRNHLRITEAAKYLNVSDALLRKKVRLQQIPFLRIGKCVRFNPDALDAWLEAHSYGGEVNYAARAR